MEERLKALCEMDMWIQASLQACQCGEKEEGIGRVCACVFGRTDGVFGGIGTHASTIHTHSLTHSLPHNHVPQGLIKFVHGEMGAYRLYTVTPRLLRFIEDLTNWRVTATKGQRTRCDDGGTDGFLLRPCVCVYACRPRYV